MLLRRVVLLVSIIFTGSIAFAAAAIAAGGGGLAPGQYTFTDRSASVFFGSARGAPPAPAFDVFVNRGLNSFRPFGNPNSPDRTVTLSTMVQITEIDPTGFSTFGCFVIPDSDFTVASSLQAASLHTTLTADEACPGIGSVVGGAPQVGPLAGGGGGGLGLPLSVDINWQGVNVVSTSHDHFTFTCLNHTEVGTNALLDSLGGSASGSIGASADLFSQSADVSAQNGTLLVQGAVQPPCFGK